MKKVGYSIHHLKMFVNMRYLVIILELQTCFRARIQWHVMEDLAAIFILNHQKVLDRNDH
jgi:hypothetical protein